MTLNNWLEEIMGEKLQYMKTHPIQSFLTPVASLSKDVTFPSNIAGSFHAKSARGPQMTLSNFNKTPPKYSIVHVTDIFFQAQSPSCFEVTLL